MENFKEGDHVRVKSANNFEGHIVKKYFDSKYNTDLYVVCNAILDVPPLEDEKNLNHLLEYLKDLPNNIETRLKCITVKLDSADEMEKI